MSLNSDPIDLNADVVLFDRENDFHEVNLPELTLRLGVSEIETPTEPLNGQGQGSSMEPVGDGVRDIQAEVVRGVDENVRCEVVVDWLGSEGLEIKIGSLDSENDVEAKTESVDRLIGAVMPVIGEEGRTEDAGDTEGGRVNVGNEIVVNDGGLGSVDAVYGNYLLCEKNGGEKGGTLRNSTEGKLVHAVDRDNLLGIEGKPNICRHEGDTFTCNEQDRNFSQVADTATGEVEGGQSPNSCPVKEILDGCVSVTVESSAVPEGASQIQSADASGSRDDDVKPHSSGLTETLGHLLDGIPGVGVRVADTDECLIHEDPNVNTHVPEVETCDGVENRAMEGDADAETNGNQFMGMHVPEAGVSQITGNESNMLNLVVDLNTYMNSDGNLNSGSGISIEGTEVKYMSAGVGSSALGQNAACYANGVGFSGNQDIASQEQVTNFEQTKANEKKDVKLAAAKPEFCISDLVWGKVRSHPWWPGQIFEPLASSVKAKKYYKKDSYLIAYFGDQTFAWNEVSRIMHFRAHFSQMENQSNLENFRYAVDCALDEVSRRVEFGLACSCIPEEVYAKIKTQIVVNAGIREESSRRDGGDSFSTAITFEPMKLVEHIKALGRCPYGLADRLEHVTTKAQLLAFYRWKGYPQLPEFRMLGVLLENDTDMSFTSNKKHSKEVIKDAVRDLKGDKWVPSGKGKLKSQDGSSRKHKREPGDSMYPNKRERSLSDLMAENWSNTPNGESGLEREAGSELISSLSGKKRKAVDAMSDRSAMKHRTSHMSAGAATKSSQSKQTYRVGDSILRVASQLNESTPILKRGVGASEKCIAKNNSKEKSVRGSFGVLSCSVRETKKSQSRKFIPTEYSTPNEMLSQLCLAAQDPMKGGYSFSISLFNFLSEFRNSVCLDYACPQKHQESPEQVSGSKTGKKSTKSETTETSELEYVKDLYWTDMMIQNVPEEASLENHNGTGGFLPKTTSKCIESQAGEFLPETPCEKGIPTAEPEAALESCPEMDSKEGTAGGDYELRAETSVGQLDIGYNEDLSPTALILNFTGFDSVPSEANLNKIFSRFGPLNESETEALKKSRRAKVVFRRRSDAETAFSSAGKYSIFGPSLVSYRLKYLPSTPSKVSPHATKRSRKDIMSTEGDAT